MECPIPSVKKIKLFFKNTSIVLKTKKAGCDKPAGFNNSGKCY